MHPPNRIAIAVIMQKLTPMHSLMMSGTSSFFAWMMTFSNPRNRPMLAIATNAENTPHSPNASGVYRRVSIGVTNNGNMYMRMLLTEIFTLFRIREDDDISFI